MLLEGDCACMPERRARSAKTAVRFDFAPETIFAFVYVMGRLGGSSSGARQALEEGGAGVL